MQSLPANTSATVPSISSVGLKYLALERGNSRKTIPAGGKIPISQVHEQVDIGEFFDMFDKQARVDSQRNLDEFSAGLAGRGPGLNEALGTLKPLVKRLTPVAHNLASSQTDLAGLFPALDRAAKESAPVAAQQGELYADLNTFFGAWAGVASLARSVDRGRALLAEDGDLFAALPGQIHRLEHQVHAPAAAERSGIARRGSTAWTCLQGRRGQLRSGAVAEWRARLRRTGAAEVLGRPDRLAALEDFTHTATVGGPLVKGLAIEQTKCSYLSLTFRNVASLLSESIGVGTVARVLPVLPPSGANNEGYPASEPANGPSEEFERDVHPPRLAPTNHLHYNAYPNAATCEAGNEAYTAGQTEIGKAASANNAKETPSRDTNALGHKYEEPSVLKDLGISTKAGGRK